MARRIGVLYGAEDSFPRALVNRINEKRVSGIVAEHLRTGAAGMSEPCEYDVIVDRASHEIPFYRSLLKQAVLSGTRVINNPFWSSADDKFFNYALAAKLGVTVPPTVLLPHREHPPATTEKSMRNLEYPLNWERIFHYVGFPAFLKPHVGGESHDVHRVDNPDQFFAAYARSGQLCMVLQRAVDFDQYFRCYVVGQKRVHIMRYDPKQVHHLRYVPGNQPPPEELGERMVREALMLCGALGYDVNTVEFAVEDEVPYAIDFTSPAPEAELESVGPENFAWIVDAVADLAIERAAEGRRSGLEWQGFLNEG
jgi:glutathione synthase/RimK-type ligase-like ATP-grasp enzyme